MLSRVRVWWIHCKFLWHSFHRILSRGGRTQHDTFIAQTVRFSSKENKQLPGCPRVFSFYVSNSLATIRKAQFPVEKRTKKTSEVNNSTVKSNYLSVLSLNLLSPVETNICAIYRNVWQLSHVLCPLTTKEVREVNSTVNQLLICKIKWLSGFQYKIWH